MLTEFFRSFKLVTQNRSKIGDDQNKVKRALLQGFANTSVHCISVSVLRGFALVAFGDPKISINYKWSGASPIVSVFFSKVKLSNLNHCAKVALLNFDIFQQKMMTSI